MIFRDFYRDRKSLSPYPSFHPQSFPFPSCPHRSGSVSLDVVLLPVTNVDSPSTPDHTRTSVSPLLCSLRPLNDRKSLPCTTGGTSVPSLTLEVKVREGVSVVGGRMERRLLPTLSSPGTLLLSLFFRVLRSNLCSPPLGSTRDSSSTGTPTERTRTGGEDPRGLSC